MSNSSFRDAVLKGLDERKEMLQYGENGCLEYTNDGINSDVLAISQLVRGGDSTALAKAILKRGSTKEIVDLIVLTFVTRNTRGGKGEKKLAYDLFLILWEEYPVTAKELLPFFVHYGYWKDLLLMLELALHHPFYDELKDATLSLMHRQWLKDVASLSLYERKLEDAVLTNNQSLVDEVSKKGPKISLLVKWLPREGKALDKRIKFVENFVKLVYPSAKAEKEDAENDDIDSWKSVAKKKYRKQLSRMTSFLNLPEVLLAAKRADEIRIHCVASKATKILTRAFLNENRLGDLRSRDVKRLKLREMFLDAIVNKKLKGSQVMPHEIVQTILRYSHISEGMEMALDAQWKSLWKGVVDQVKARAAEEGLEFDPTKMVPICDTSGSMTGTPMEVSIALGIGISEITHEAFQNMVMTFSERPEWFYLNKDDSIVQKVRKLSHSPWGLNTDFAKAYDLVLEVCEKNKLRREDMPCLIVFSDMQFDEAADAESPMTMFQHIRSRVRLVGSNLGWADCEPTPIVFWNLRDGCGHPVQKETEGTVLLSGFSPSLLKLVMNGEALKEDEVEVVEADGTVVTKKIRVTPEEILEKMINDPLYDPVRKVLGTSTEGALREYELLGVEKDFDNADFEII